MQMVSLCLSCQDASTDMQHDLSGSSRDLDLRSKFEIDLTRSTCTCFDASRREKHDGIKTIAVSLLVQKLFAKN